MPLKNVIIYIEKGHSIIHRLSVRVISMEKMKLTENMVAVLKALASREDGKGFAREVMAHESLNGKTFNGVNATLAAAAGKGLCTKAKALFGEGDNAKMLTQYTITDAGRNAIAPSEAEVEEGEAE